jgi:quinol monooxygenase YgiN
VILIHCRFRIPAEARAAWTESAQRMAALSRAEEGCIGYAFSFDVNDPEVAYAYEAWESQELLDAHAVTPHHDVRMAELRQWDIGYEEISFYDTTNRRDMLAEITEQRRSS